LDTKEVFHKANKKPLGEWAVNRLLMQPALSRQFGRVYLYCDPESLRLRDEPQTPILICCTHRSWWDGYMTGELNRALFKRDGYLMMEEVNLARYPFFTWIGVYGVDRDDPRKALASIEYTVQLLTEQPNRAVCIFPQGTITHPDTRPLGIFGGVGHIAKRLGKCAIVPVALRYDFRMDQAPDAFAMVGPPICLDNSIERFSAKEITEQLEHVMSENDDALHADLMKSAMYNDRLRGYKRIRAGRGSSSKAWDSFLRMVGLTKDNGAER